MNVSCAHLINKEVDNRMCPLDLLESLTADYDVVKETTSIQSIATAHENKYPVCHNPSHSERANNPAIPKHISPVIDYLHIKIAQVYKEHSQSNVCICYGDNETFVIPLVSGSNPHL